ncbi:CENPC protein, partial [Halcyon senegalensis]|nr:CENPC protein [Halcyon senegalensis]
SEKEKTERKNGKTSKVQAGALTEQKVDDLDVGVRDFRGTAESDPASDSERKVLKSKRQNRTHVGKTKKDAVRQGSPNEKKDMSWKPEPEEMMSSPPGLQTKASRAEQCKTRVVPSNDSPVPSAEHQQEQAPKKIRRSFKNLQLVSKASQNLVRKKQTAQQKLPKDTVAKRLTETPGKKLKKSVKKRSTKKPQLQRKESSNSEPSEEELEREPVKLTEAFTPPSRRKLQPAASQKSRKSEKPNKVLQPLESLGPDNKTLIKALEYFLDSVKKSGKKQLPAESLGKLPQNIHRRMSEGVCSNPEDAESQADSDSSSVQGVARKKQKLSDVKRKSNKRKRNMPRGFLNAFSDSSEDLGFQGRPLLSDNAARHKIVMPTHTPNVRRTKRVRVKPLEYWRGERINYTMSSSGLVISGIMCPETKPHRKIKQRRDGHKQKMDETRSEIPATLDHTLADTSKPTIVLDPITNKEVLLKCINTDIRHECFFKDEAVEVYKNLNTSAFATGRLILKPLKEKGRQFVHMDTIAFHVIHGKIIFTLHETSYSLTTGSCFYVPAGNEYNIRNILNEESVLFFTQLK